MRPLAQTRRPTQNGPAAASCVDSRLYRFVFGIRSPDDLPADFDPAETSEEFRIGVFLPTDDLRPRDKERYPARVLLLARRTLVILAHPSAKEPPSRIALDDLQFVESGEILLHGWLRFGARQLGRTLLYSTCASRPVDQFLRRLRGEYAAPQSVTLAARTGAVE